MAIVQDLGEFDVGYPPRIGFHKIRGATSSSATSIDTEENSLEVPKAQSTVLIYMRTSKHDRHNDIQVQ